jgi:hypothetical protein
MESYITQELPALAGAERFAVQAGARRCDRAFSMGGHGALTLALRHPDLFARAVRAFAPICRALRECPWGVKAFAGYLGRRPKAAWAANTTPPMLIKAGHRVPPLLHRPGRGRQVPGGAIAPAPAGSRLPRCRPAARCCAGTPAATTATTSSPALIEAPPASSRGCCWPEHAHHPGSRAAARPGRQCPARGTCAAPVGAVRMPQDAGKRPAGQTSCRKALRNATCRLSAEELAGLATAAVAAPG